MDNPDIEAEQYQYGTLYGYEIREYLLDRYGHTCQYCGGTSGDEILEWEHIVPKSKGGSDKVSNATLACHTCNQDKGSRALSDWMTEEKNIAGSKERNKRKELASARVNGIQKVVNGKVNGVSNRYCAWANNLRRAVEEELFRIFPDVECAGGGTTKYNRTLLGFPKDHQYDALCIGTMPHGGYADRTKGYFLAAKCIGRGTRFRSKINSCGIVTVKYDRSTNQKRRYGFQNGDIVRANVPKGKYKGVHVGRVMTRSSGSFAIRTMQGDLVQTNHQYCTRMQPDTGYQYEIRKST